MPYLHLTLSPSRPFSSLAKQALARACTTLLETRLRKRAEVTAVRITLCTDEWLIGGQSIAPELCRCHGEVLITAGTNTSAEKAAFIAEWQALLREHCGPLPEASYLVIHEIAADSWGYDGQTQAGRLAARQGL